LVVSGLEDVSAIAMEYSQIAFIVTMRDEAVAHSPAKGAQVLNRSVTTNRHGQWGIYAIKSL
jgi:hypothetical protein